MYMPEFLNFETLSEKWGQAVLDGSIVVKFRAQLAAVVAMDGPAPPGQKKADFRTVTSFAVFAPPERKGAPSTGKRTGESFEADRLTLARPAESIYRTPNQIVILRLHPARFFATSGFDASGEPVLEAETALDFVTLPVPRSPAVSEVPTPEVPRNQT